MTDLGLLPILLSITAAIVPTVIYVLLIYWIDRYEKEPLLLLGATFLWGALPAVILAIIFERVAGAPLTFLSPAGAEFVSLSVVAPVVEEITKGLALVLLYLLFRSEFDDVLDGIVYGALIGLGFAMTENLVYFVNSFGQGGWATWLLTVAVRAGLFGLIHAFYTALVGASLGYMRLSGRQRRQWFPLVGLAAAMLFHSLHNFVLSLAPNRLLMSLGVAAIGDWTGILLLLLIVLFAWRKEKSWIRNELAEEVTLGTLSQGDYEKLTGQRSLLASLAVAGATKTEGQEDWRRLAQAATELAIKKHQRGLPRASAHQRQQAAQTIETLRRDILQIRAHRDEMNSLVACPACDRLTRSKNSYCTSCGTELDKDTELVQDTKLPEDTALARGTETPRREEI